MSEAPVTVRPDTGRAALWVAGSVLALAAALVLDAVFLRYAWLLKRTDRSDLPMRTFRYSIQYLALLFAALLVDHYLPIRF